MNYLDLIRKNPRYLTYGFSHYFFSFLGQTFFISLFVAALNEEFGWQNTTFASIYSFATLVSAFLLPTIGKGIDLFKIRYVSLTVALLAIIGCLVLFWAHHWVVIFLGILAVRMGGQGIMTLIGATTIGRYFNQDRGKALSLSVIGVSAAEITIPVFAVWAISSIGWRSSWLLVAILVVCVFLPLIFLLVPLNDSFQRVVKSSGKQRVGEGLYSETNYTRKEVLRDTQFWVVLPIILFMPFYFTGIVFNQNLLMEAKAWPITWMAICFSGYGISKILTMFLIGALVDRFSAGRVIQFTLFPVLIGTILLNLFQGQWAGYLFMCSCGISGGITVVTSPALWAERYGQKHLGAIKSMVAMIVVFAAAIAPIIFSFFMTNNFRLSIFIWVLFVLGLIITTFNFIDLSKAKYKHN